MNLQLRPLLSVFFRFIVPAVTFFAIPKVSHCEGTPYGLNGYITRTASPSDFDVNGFHVIVTSATRVEQDAGKDRSTVQAGGLDLYVGMPVQVSGKLQPKSHSITATKLVLIRREPQKISAAGIVDGIPAPSSGAVSPGDHLVRADGYLVLISATTAVTFNPPLDETSAFQVNVWVSFQGTEREDGVVVADKAAFAKNIVNAAEDKLRSKREYDPAAVAPGTKQGAVNKAFVGLNPKLIPPYKDSAMQARVDAIAATLIPKYQRDLSDTDETKIHFRFQLVDNKKWHDALTFPSGIILVPHQVVEVLQNDSQLATVLADNIVCVLEKQGLHALPTEHKMAAESWVGLVVPGLSLASYATYKDLLRHFEQESGRTSLFLLHDAGYDIFQAPITWWLLAGSKGVADTPLPERAKYIYKILGETWRAN